MTDTGIHPPRPQTSPITALAAPMRAVLPAGRDTTILLVTLLLLALWGLTILGFGIPALVWPMKLIVPSLVVALVLLTWGM
ncbi:MAG: hypothetical protein QNJ44_10375 [Rhodobacter sp.]|nr:hypothetical protein [Rhodobacter sp.]